MSEICKNLIFLCFFEHKYSNFLIQQYLAKEIFQRKIISPSLTLSKKESNLMMRNWSIFLCCVIGIIITSYKTAGASKKTIKESEWHPIRLLLVYFYGRKQGKKGKEIMINVIGLFTLPSTWLSHRNEIKMCVEWDFPGKSCKNHDGNKE